MDCGEARKIIYLTSGTEPLTSELVEAKKHVRHCAECTEFFREEEALKNLIKERAPKEKASSNLRENILAEIAKREQRLSNHLYNIFYSSKIVRTVPIILIVVFLILIATSIFYFISSNQQGDQSLVSQLAEDHITNIPEVAQILSSEPRNVEDWFRGKVDFVVKVPELRGTKLIGGRLCRIKNNRIALLFYEKDKKPISLFVMDNSVADLSSIGKVEIQGKKLYQQSEKGCNLIFWREKGVVYALVSDIQREELMRLVPRTALTE